MKDLPIFTFGLSKKSKSVKLSDSLSLWKLALENVESISSLFAFSLSLIFISISNFGNFCRIRTHKIIIPFFLFWPWLGPNFVYFQIFFSFWRFNDKLKPQIVVSIKKPFIVCRGFEPSAAEEEGLKAQTIPKSNSGHPQSLGRYGHSTLDHTYYYP